MNFHCVKIMMNVINHLTRTKCKLVLVLSIFLEWLSMDHRDQCCHPQMRSELESSMGCFPDSAKSLWNSRNFWLNGSLFWFSTVCWFSKNFPWKSPNRWFSFRNFRNFWLNEKCPWSWQYKWVGLAVKVFGEYSSFLPWPELTKFGYVYEVSWIIIVELFKHIWILKNTEEKYRNSMRSRALLAFHELSY